MRWAERLKQAVRRGWQFLHYVGAYLVPLDDGEAQRLLSEEAYALFCAMSRGDRLHALCVLHYLQQRMQVPNELAQAALLHDVGKAGGRLKLFHRVVAALLQDLDEAWLRRLADADPRGRGYPFYIHLHHAEIGAARCAAVGCPLATVMLVRYHEDHETASQRLDPSLWGWLQALEEADEHC
ncbi:MAG: hypothetical protein J7M05_12960 [Anaerolineae bacterium]|nr:hypothetical protein [Anaerolineae bacterium]